MELVKKRHTAIKKYWKVFALSLLILVLIGYQLYWLCLGVLFVFLLRVVFSFLFKCIKNKLLLQLTKGFSFFLIIFMLSIGAKLFVFGVFKIPSSSMENTLYPNDVILVNKIVYGPSLPTTPFEIPWVNFLFYLHEQSRAKLDKQWWKPRRFSGIATVEQGDVLVFQETRTFFVVKRCVGIPGDTIEISKGKVHINHTVFNAPATVKNKYKLTVTDKELFYANLDSLQIESSLQPSATFNNQLVGFFAKSEYAQLKELASVATIEQSIDSNVNQEDLFLEKNIFNWSIDTMGPFIIPKIGLKIQLNDFTYNVYKKTLEFFEGVTIENESGYFYVNGKVATEYVFKKDYIFVLGDHRNNSKDSRYTGFVPFETVVGKVQYVLYSNYNEQFHWERLFKKVV